MIENLQIKHPEPKITETIILANKINELTGKVNELEKNHNNIISLIHWMTQLIKDKLELSDEDFFKKYDIK